MPQQTRTFLGSFSLLTAIALAFFCGCQPADPTATAEAPPPWTLPPPEDAIQGRVSVQLIIRDDEEPQRKLEIALLRPKAADAIREVRDQRWVALADPRNFNDGFRWLDLQAIGKVATLPEFNLQITRTDNRGFFRFSDVPPGNYLLYAQYSTRYAKGYWLIPVEKHSREGLTVDLNNSNFTEVFNAIFR